jgi:hypothetical protein
LEGKWNDNAAMRAQRWHEMLWSACDRRSLQEFRATPLTILTYNYDRSVEFAFARSLESKFHVSTAECAAAMDCIGPIHLHGQLGFLKAFTTSPSRVVPFGGDLTGLTENNFATAAAEIKIVHEPTPQDEAFIRARDALSCADRLIILGFGYAPQNVQRLLLETCLKKSTQIYLCTTGFTPAQTLANIRPFFSSWTTGLQTGGENQDIVQFLRHFPGALL